MSSISVLIVEDNDEIAGLVRLALERSIPQLGEVQRAADGETALRLFDDFHPNVVVLDHGLPGADGDVVAERIRHIEPNVGIVSFTALDPQRDWADENVLKDAAGFKRLAQAVIEASSRSDD